MKQVTASLIVFSIAAFGQTGGAAAPAAQPAGTVEVSPDTVILKVAGKPLTKADFDRLLATFPPETQQSARVSPTTVIQNYFLMLDLAKRAQAEKLDQQSPYKEQLELQRVQFLATTVVNRQSEQISVTEAEQKQRYEQEKVSKLEKAKISAILIMFGENMVKTQVNMADPSKPQASPIKPLREEAEARKLAADLVKQARGGANFAELAKKHSEEQNSAAKGGDFGVIRRGDKIPDDIKNAVFALNNGQISDPIRQPMGFYIVKMEERSIPAFDEVKASLREEIHKERFEQWMSDVQKQYQTTIEKPEAFPLMQQVNPQAMPKK